VCCCFQRIFHGFNLQRYRRYYVYFPIIPLCLQLYLEFHLFSTSRQFVWFPLRGRGRGGCFNFFLCSSTCVFRAVNNNVLAFYQTCQLIRAEDTPLVSFFSFVYTRCSHRYPHAHVRNHGIQTNSQSVRFFSYLSDLRCVLIFFWPK